MNWTMVALTVMPTSLLLVQAISCLKRLGVSMYMRGFGLLSILLWGVSVVLGIIWVSGTLVLSSEFGIVMVQGVWAGFGLAVVLVGAAVSVGMGLHVCRLQAERPKRWPWLLGPGLLIGVCAALRLKSLYPNDLPPLRLYHYDLWWPPLLVWLSLCLLDIVLTTVKVHHRAARLWCATVVVTGLALLALSQPRLADAHAEILWRSCLLVLVPISMSLVTWLFLPLSPRLGVCRYGVSRVLIWVPAGIGVWSGIFSLQEWHWQTVILLASWPATMYQTGMGWAWHWQTVAGMASLLWLCWPGLIGLIAPLQLARACRSVKPSWVMLRRLSGQQIGLLAASACLVVELAVLSYVDRLDRAFLLNGGVLVWLLLAEAIAGGPLSRLLQRLVDWQQWSDFGTEVLQRGRRPLSWLKSLLSVPSMSVLIGKALLGMAILVALSELPNAHKTLIQPFRVLGLPERTEFGKDGAERDATGQAISEQVVNTLGLLQQEVQQEIILSLQPDSEDEGGRKKFELTSVGDSSNVSAALSKSAELEVGGVKIPMSLLFTPVQGPIRWMLGVRSINASVQFDQGGYALLARSDAGETWKLVVSPDKQARPEAPTSPEVIERSKVRISPEIIERLAADLAFHIIKSEKLLASALTKSWEAFSPFKMGLTEWNKFETNQDYHAIGEAIKHFRKAIQEDPGFAFAHYRLGLALQKDGQPGLAVKAFRASLKADPSLIPAYIALASTLYDFERTSFLAEIGSPLDFLPRLPSQDERIDEARDLWLKVLRLPERGDSVANLGSAYYGLCRQAVRQARNEERRRTQQEEKRSDPGENTEAQEHDMSPEQWYYIAYYYCKRAEVLYASLATAQQASLEVKKGEAYVLNTLGVILANFPRPKEAYTDSQQGWKCWTDTGNKFHSYEMLQYFKRALDLLPDDYRLRCYVARTAYALGEHTPLERLEGDAQAHLYLANAHRRLAKVCAAIEREELSPAGHVRLQTPSYSRYVRLCTPKDPNDKGLKSARRNTEERALNIARHYQRALHEYDEVIRREPMNLEARTNYAYTVWEWRIHAGHDEQFRGWIEYYAEHALHHARKAVTLASISPDVRVLTAVRSNFGKALLAHGSPDSAIQELQQVVKDVPNHPAFHEIRWALAQAYLCVASYDKSVGFQAEAVQSEKHGRALLGDILMEERAREFQLFSSRPGVADSAWGKLICQPSLGVESLPDPPVAMKTVWTATAHLQ